MLRANVHLRLIIVGDIALVKPALTVCLFLLLFGGCSNQIDDLANSQPNHSSLTSNSPKPLSTTVTTSTKYQHKKLLFISNQDGDREIYVSDIGGRQLNQLTQNDRDDYGASWSPDGQHILFSSNRDNGNTEVYVMKSDGSEQVNLSKHGGFDGDAQWSPDGQSVVFISDREGDLALYVMSKYGENIKRLSVPMDEEHNYSAPAWSPDGQWIAYRKLNKNVKADLWVVNLNSNLHQQLTDHPKHNDGQVHWSPDSKTLLYHSRRNREFNIYQYDLAQQKETKITNLPSADSQPKWSHRGEHIVFLSTRGASGRTQIFIMKKDGSQLQSITDNRYQVGDVTWLDDDSGLLYVSWQRGRVSNVFFADLVTGQQTIVTPAKGFQSQPLIVPAVLSNQFTNHVSL